LNWVIFKLGKKPSETNYVRPTQKSKTKKQVFFRTKNSFWCGWMLPQPSATRNRTSNVNEPLASPLNPAAGLPDGFFSNQKSKFGKIWEGLRRENVDIF
jgi:hypothetical protein